ncbi:hypothetical protein ULMA_16000 [Patiriisocius marinus]|uniref:Uncharacterized protein n=1 Tax=Patiriisocius marinus TaxID=1397112 RepID=A0A5J4IYG1_9FLAO|nr:hypothetical protein [Patiriisocius marinus]GER59492.1 hypothetical protein ULMA_16000 [Patiriisocius marinus]
MKSGFNSNLFKKEMKKEQLNILVGGTDPTSSGGTESGNTNCSGQPCDTYTTVYDDNCKVNYTSVNQC